MDFPGVSKVPDVKKLKQSFSGSDVKARTLRSTLWVALNFGGNSVILRLISNLVLTRLLFPEAFGLMAITQVFLAGLALFSDTGVGLSIIQNKRGDEAAFLNTAWTVQILRGAVLWLLTFLIAAPVARLYGEPVLVLMLPVLGFTFLVKGFQPTAVHTASKHLQMGRLLSINFLSSLATAVGACILAYYMRSVWALVVANVGGAILTLACQWLLLPGARNRLQIERAALSDLFHFGKYVFLASIAGFAVAQGDRAIIGLYVPVATLGVFNIGYTLAKMPVELAQMLQRRVILPLYRLKPIEESERNRAAIFRTRRLLSGGMMAVGLVLALAGPWLTELLYDDRYIAAGPVVTLFGLSMVPMLTMRSTSPMLLAMGDSKASLILVVAIAVLNATLLFLGIWAFGIAGAILAPGAAILLVTPLRWHYARRYNALDPIQEVGMTAVGLAAAGAICAWHWDKVSTLFS